MTPKSIVKSAHAHRDMAVSITCAIGFAFVVLILPVLITLSTRFPLISMETAIPIRPFPETLRAIRFGELQEEISEQLASLVKVCSETGQDA